MSFKHRGDTLVEVLFAFAILSLVMSTAFSGALSAYKSSLAAQNQTQASFLAQYQAEALKSYRDALDWDASTGVYTFLDGTVGGGGGLPAMKDYLLSGEFMMCKKDNYGTPYWAVVQKTDLCSSPDNRYTSYAEYLAPELGSSARIEITLTTADIRSPNQVTAKINQVTANIEVIWTPRNSRIEQSVVNSVLLTK